MNTHITAILVTYNSQGVILQALESLSAANNIAEIIVVDNASSDQTCAVIRNAFPKVTLIQNTRNDGFGRANNIALARVTTCYALLVNPDAIIQEAAIAALLHASQRYPDAAILAPQLYDERGQLHRTHKRNVFAREQMRDRYEAPDGDICAEFLSGAVWLLNKSLLKNDGLFDPNIFLFYEDDDLCMRTRKHGHSLILVHDACAVHLMGASSGAHNAAAEFFKQKHMIRSRLYIEEKYHGPSAAQKLAAKLKRSCRLKSALYLLQFKIHKRTRYKGRLAGIAEFNAQDRKPQAA